MVTDLKCFFGVVGFPYEKRPQTQKGDFPTKKDPKPKKVRLAFFWFLETEGLSLKRRLFFFGTGLAPQSLSDLNWFLVVSFPTIKDYINPRKVRRGEDGVFFAGFKWRFLLCWLRFEKVLFVSTSLRGHLPVSLAEEPKKAFVLLLALESFLFF